MKRYSSLDPISGGMILDYDVPAASYDESLTDKSHFIPTSEAVKRLASAPPLGHDVVRQIYDFPDGRDNGSAVPLSRTKGVDMAVLSTAIRLEQDSVNTAIAEAKDKARVRAEIDSMTLNPSVSSTSGQSSDSSGS